MRRLGLSGSAPLAYRALRTRAGNKDGPTCRCGAKSRGCRFLRELFASLGRQGSRPRRIVSTSLALQSRVPVWFPSSAWEPPLSKLRFESLARETAHRRSGLRRAQSSRASRKCVPKRSLGTRLCTPTEASSHPPRDCSFQTRPKFIQHHRSPVRRLRFGARVSINAPEGGLIAGRHFRLIFSLSTHASKPTHRVVIRVPFALSRMEGNRFHFGPFHATQPRIAQSCPNHNGYKTALKLT